MSKERIVLAVKDGGYSDIEYRLCKWGQEFVTWTYNHTTQGYTSGHYFTNIFDAVEDFKERG